MTPTKHHTPAEGLRTFKPDVCCEHNWQPSAFGMSDFCLTCGATCTRAENGSIEEYDADVQF